MLESFVIMLREGVESALVIGIIIILLRRTGRRDLERPVFLGLGLAIIASIGAAIILNLLPINEEVYEGVLYWISALFISSMIWWMHSKSKTLYADIKSRVDHTVESTASGRSLKEVWGLGVFTFLMIFREGVEAVMLLSAVNLTTETMLSFIGSFFGLAISVIICVMFIKGSLRVNLRGFFEVTEWILGILIIQLLFKGYHEFAEAGIVPATRSMAVAYTIVQNNSLFIIAMISVPVLFWLAKKLRKLNPI